MRKILKRPIFISAIFLLALIILGSYGYFGRTKKEPLDFVRAERGSVLQEVNVTGRVKASESVDLAFEKTGKVSAVFYEVGERVKKGDILVKLESGELEAQLLSAIAILESEQAKLEELEKGTRPEEIRLAETKVANAKIVLEHAERNLENTKSKAEAELSEVYNSAITTAQKSAVAARNSLLVLTDIQYSYFIKNDQESLVLAEAKRLAVEALLGAKDAGFWKSEFLTSLQEGAFGKVKMASLSPTWENIDLALNEILAALQKVKLAIDAVPVKEQMTSAEKTNLSAEKSNIQTELKNISDKQQAIAVKKENNKNNIALSEAEVTDARNGLQVSQDDLALKKAGAIEEQIAFQRAKVKSAKASLQNVQAQLAKIVISAPFEGIVTKQDAEIGEIVQGGDVLTSIMSESEFEIEADVAEVDVARIKIGSKANVTLDAYGKEQGFEAKVIFIDPAETIVDGVAVYKTILQFLEESELIKSGMTANIEIEGDKREAVIFVPQRAVFSENGDRFVRVLEGKDVNKVKVKTGLKGSDGKIEIVEGLKEGDKVLAVSEK